MAEDWLADVRKYVANADEAVVDKIVKYLGIALRNRDSSLVSFSDKKETDRVRENFLKKKLGLTHDDATLDAAIADVGTQMKADRTKNRVTVYYLLAQHFGLLNIFGGVAGAAAAAGAAGAAATLGSLGGADGNGKDDDTGSAAPLAAAALGGAAVAGTAAAPAAAAPAPTPAPTPAPPPPASATPQTAYSSGEEESSGGGMGWLPWLLLGLLLLALLFFGLRYCSKQDVAAPVSSDGAVVGAPADPAAADPAAVPGDAATMATPAAAVPVGAGVVAADRQGKPSLTVYFDVGKSAVHNDLAVAAAAVKAYVAGNPTAKLVVSGFNDPTGNAAANAELSKTRAQAVKAALEKLGIPAAAVVLEKPADTTGAGANNAESRRVEVVVVD